MALEAVRLDLPIRMTEEEFDAWVSEENRAEFVDGEVILMSPVSSLHNDIVHFLITLVRLYLEFRPGGRIFGSEFQIRPRHGIRREPDLIYVSKDHADRIHPTFLAGSPDSVWEIVSPESVDRDWRVKFQEYEAAGVPEYWVIDPRNQVVHLYRLGADGKYARVAETDGALHSETIPGFWLRPEWLWQEPLPGALQCLREMGVLA